MNYIGSKLSLLSFIKEGIEDTVQKKDYTFGDYFAGTGVVGEYFKENHQVYSNDLQFYSYVLNYVAIQMNHKPNYEKVVQKYHLNIENESDFLNYLSALKDTKGFIATNYSNSENDGEKGRLYFSYDNALRIDSIRTKIENFYQDNDIDIDTYYYLIASLIKAADLVANTAIVYGAYLKKLKKNAKIDLKLEPIEITTYGFDNKVFNDDAIKIAKEQPVDVLYLDPPYNARQYSSNYHILETIAKYDNPEIHGKTGLRDTTSQRSDFSSKRNVSQALNDLIAKAKAKYIFISYNNEGILSMDEFKEILSKYGTYKLLTKKYKRFTTKTVTNEKEAYVTECLHCLIKEDEK